MKEAMILQLETAKWALHQNLADLSHEESVITPENGGNSANWVLGHLVTAYTNLLRAVGEQTVDDGDRMAPYQRGSGPLDPAKALSFSELLTEFDQGHERVIAKLSNLSDEDLAAPSPVSPRNDPDETIGSFVSLIACHQAYHLGQTGVLRRVLGRDGAIA